MHLTNYDCHNYYSCLQVRTSARKVPNSDGDRGTDSSSEICFLSANTPFTLCSYSDRSTATNSLLFKSVRHSFLCISSNTIQICANGIHPFLEQKCSDGQWMSFIQKLCQSSNRGYWTRCHQGSSQGSFRTVRDPAIDGVRSQAIFLQTIRYFFCGSKLNAMHSLIKYQH